MTPNDSFWQSVRVRGVMRFLYLLIVGFSMGAFVGVLLNALTRIPQ